MSVSGLFISVPPTEKKKWHQKQSVLYLTLEIDLFLLVLISFFFFGDLTVPNYHHRQGKLCDQWSTWWCLTLLLLGLPIYSEQHRWKKKPSCLPDVVPRICTSGFWILFSLLHFVHHQVNTTPDGTAREDELLSPLPFTIIRIIYLLHGNCCDDQESNPQCYRTHFAGFLDYQMRWDAEMKRFASSFSDRLGYRRIILDVQQTESSPQ